MTLAILILSILNLLMICFIAFMVFIIGDRQYKQKEERGKNNVFIS
jgi:preprotein translocase subunit YajC